MKAKQLDQLFDNATADMTPYLDVTQAYRGDRNPSHHTVQNSVQPKQTAPNYWADYSHKPQTAFA